MTAAETQAGGQQEEADPAMAAIASLILPGVGQFLNGQEKRALYWGVGFIAALFIDGIIFVVSSILTMFFIGIFGFLLIPLVHVVVHGAAAYDAYDQANKINSGEVVVEN